MPRIVSALAMLGAAKTGLGLGYRVLNLDGTVYSAFSTTGVVETNVAGTYRVEDGVTVPDAGGYIVFGTAGTDLAEAAVEGTSPDAGAITFTYTLTSDVDDSPIAGADVWVTTDALGSNLVASGVTDAFGQVVFYLDAGTYYVWRQLAGWTFTNPDTEVVA